MKYLFNPFFLGSSLIFILHFIIVNMTNTFYSVDRIIIISFLSLYLLYELVYNKRVIDKFIYQNIFVLLFAYAFLQTYFSQAINSEFEILQQLYISLYFLLLIIFFLIFKSKKYTLSSYLFFITSISIIIITFLLFHFILVHHTAIDIINYYFTNYRFLNHLQTIIIPSLGLALFLSKSEKSTITITILLVINFLLLLETGARGSSYAILFAYMFLLFTNIKSKQLRQHIGMMLFIYIFSLCLYNINSFLFNETIDSSRVEHLFSVASSGRIDIYKAIFPYLFDFQHVFSALGFSPVDLNGYRFLHPHNLPLYIFLGLGSFGLLVLLVASMYILKSILQEYFQSESIIKKYLFIILLAIIIHSMVSGIYISPLTALLILYLLFILSNYYLKKESKSQFVSHNLYRIELIYIITFIVSINYLSYANYSLKKNYTLKKEYKGNRLYMPGIMRYSNQIFKN